MNDIASRTGLTNALSRLLLPLLVLVLAALSGTAFSGPKAASGQLLPTGPYAGASDI